MLGHLARWLRAAGYDAESARAGESDRRLLWRAAQEGRLLLTFDRALAALPGAYHVPAALEAAVQVLATRLGVDWLWQPFSRCVACNGELVPDRAALLDAPAPVRALGVRRCIRCGRIFWQGSHVACMRRWLAFWRAAYPPAKG